VTVELSMRERVEDFLMGGGLYSDPDFFRTRLGCGWRRGVVTRRETRAEEPAYLHFRSETTHAIGFNSQGSIVLGVFEEGSPDVDRWWKYDRSLRGLLWNPAVSAVKLTGILETFRGEIGRDPERAGWRRC